MEGWKKEPPKKKKKIEGCYVSIVSVFSMWLNISNFFFKYSKLLIFLFFFLLHFAFCRERKHKLGF